MNTFFNIQFVRWLATNAHHLFSNQLGRAQISFSSLLSSPCSPVYGVYIERHYTPAGKELPDRSYILVRPSHKFLWIRRGLIIEGLCLSRQDEEVRRFESLKVEVHNLDPVMVSYSYLAKTNGVSFFNDGFLRFEHKVEKVYSAAIGYFTLPYLTRRSRRARSVQIRFEWTRIPNEEVKANTGKKSLQNVDDLRVFLRAGRGGQ